MLRQKPKEVELLILGAGWTSTFLIPLLDVEKVSHVETTTSGRDGTIPFRFDPESDDVEPYKSLPPARTVLVTFPLVGTGQSKRITSLYRKIHGEKNNWIQLGSTGIFNQEPEWSDDNSAYDKEDKRAIAEDELKDVADGCILNLCGLYGGPRKPRTWIPRLAKSKEDVRKRKSVHFVHGSDVARAILLTHRNFTPAKRWIVADLRTYDWYDLIMSFSALAEEEAVGATDEERQKDEIMRLQFAKWVGELMVEEGVKALPREISTLGRRLDSRGFWAHHESWPKHRRLA